MAYAIGLYSKAICDRCGFRYDYLDLRQEWTGFKVCPECYEPKHPQLEPVHHPADPQALHQPRPDVSETNDVTITLPIFSEDTAREERLPALVATLGAVSLGGDVATPQSITAAATSLSATTALDSVTISTTSISITTYTVTVATGTNSYGYGNKFYIAGLSGASPTLTLNEGSTYKFDQSDSSNATHPLRFSTTANGTQAGVSEYTTGVTTNGTPGSSGAYTQISVAVGAPTLYYYCTNHSGMGGHANTP